MWMVIEVEKTKKGWQHGVIDTDRTRHRVMWWGLSDERKAAPHV